MRFFICVLCLSVTPIFAADQPTEAQAIPIALEPAPLPGKMKIKPGKKKNDAARPARQEIPGRDATPSDGLTVKLVRATETRELPADYPKEATPGDWQPGYALTFMVEGANLTHIKTETLKLDVLQTKDGGDIRTRQGAPNYHTVPFAKLAPGGKYGIFELESIVGGFGQLDEIRIQGSVVVVVAEGKETLRSEPIDLGKKKRLKLPGYNVGVGFGDVGFGGVGNPFSGLFEGLGLGDKVDPAKIVPIQVAGNIDRIAEIAVVVDGKKLGSQGSSWTDAMKTVDFVKEGDGDGVIEIDCWKKIEAVRVPFSHNMAEAPTK